MTHGLAQEKTVLRDGLTIVTVLTHQSEVAASRSQLYPKPHDVCAYTHMHARRPTQPWPITLWVGMMTVGKH